jgi:hypothetical protein
VALFAYLTSIAQNFGVSFSYVRGNFDGTKENKKDFKFIPSLHRLRKIEIKQNPSLKEVIKSQKS